MSTTDLEWGLPDPARHADFYNDVLTKRLLAFFIDSTLILIITMLLVPLTGFTAIFFFGFLGFVVSLIYRSVSLANKSATPGMRFMGIEFRNHLGERLSGKMAFVHALLFLITFSTVLPMIISIILMLTTARGQSLTDIFLGTALINRSAAH